MANKIISFETFMLSTDKHRVFKRETVYTNDKNSAELNFNVKDIEVLTQYTPNILLYMRDGSFFQITDQALITVEGTTIKYTLQDNEGKHGGLARTQLVLITGESELASAKFEFNIESGLGGVASEVMIQDWSTLLKTARDYIDDFIDGEAARQTEFESNEAARQSLYDDLVETGVLQSNIDTKLAELEEEYAPAFASVTAQLAQTVEKSTFEQFEFSTNQQLAQKVGSGVKAELEDLSANVLGAIDGTGGSFDLLSVPQDYSVSPIKTDFVEKVILSDNLVNPETISVGYNINGNDGSLLSNASYDASDFIEVKPGTTYYTPYITRIAQYDSSKGFISYADATSVTTSVNTAFIRVVINVSSEMQFRLNEGSVKTWDAYADGVKVKKLQLDNESVSDVIFDGEQMKKMYKINEENANFVYHASANLFNKKDISQGVIFNLDGSTRTSASYSISSFVEVEPSAVYSYSRGVEVIQYDADKNYITGTKDAEAPYSIITEPNTAYVRFSIYNPHLDIFMFVKGETLPADYIPYDIYRFGDTIQISAEEKKFEGQTQIAMGDSITNNNSAYWSVLRPLLGITTVDNQGTSGSSIAVRGAYTHSFVERFSSMGEADLITVLGGTNDFSSAEITLGTMDDRIDTTFYGACHILFSGLVDKYPLKKIVAFTPIPRENMQSVNGAGETIFQYADALKEVCAYYAIPCMDILRNSQLRPFNETNKNMYMPDGLHPNVEGHKLLAEQMLPFMKGL